MKLFLVVFIIFYTFTICIGLCTRNRGQDSVGSDTNEYLRSLQMIRKRGYPAEAHVVQTKDGYLLEMHRIPNGYIHNSTDLKSTFKPPILLQHGFLSSSMDFILLEPEKGLAFLLADLGFDVWLGNNRGNTYSRAHASLSPNDRKFWNFTWHESALYDLPAQIDFIREYTKQEKIIFIGHSMGTTMNLVLTTSLPEYNNKIELSLLMATIGYVKHMKSPLLKLLVPLSDRIKVIDDFIENGELLPHNVITKILEKILCEFTHVESRLCMSVIFMIFGNDPKNFDTKLLKTLMGHYPAGYSAKAANHYSQLIKSGKFRQYDYGPSGNMIQYGLPEPPDYKVEKISTPMYIYEGKNDFLSTLPDVKALAKRLKTLRAIRVVDNLEFSHLDFLISHEAKKLVYDQLINDLMDFLKNKKNKKICE